MDNFTHLDTLASAYAESRIFQTAVELNIFDVIGEKRIPAGDIASIIQTDKRATGLFLNALAAMGLLLKEEDLFSLTETAKRYLLSSSPICYAAMIRFESAMWSTWERLAVTIKTGIPARAPDMYQSSARETEGFIMAMHQLVSARGDANYIADHLDMSGIRSILDIGSGPGTYPMAICRKHPSVSVTIFDLPGTLEVTRNIIKKEGDHLPITLFAGDYNKDALPTGFDMVFMSNVIHGDDEEKNRVLMRNVFNSLAPGGCLVIKDHIMDRSLTKPACGAIFSIYMLLTTKGRDYGYHEVHQWLQNAGFSDIRLKGLPPPMTSSIVTARK